MHRILVREIMSSPVVTVGPDQLAVDAAQIMEEYSIRRLPVVDDDNILLGIVTDTDVLEAETAEHVISSYEPDVEAEWLAVEDIMSDEVVSVSPDCTVGELAALFIKHKVGGVPVVESQANKRRVIGIVTETDIFQMIVDAWQAEQS
ncbi:MAG: CBS domain-containing protein [Caldilineaceae bacterium]